MSRTTKYGWVPDVPDYRDFTFKASPALVELPEVVDLRPNLPEVYDQGILGSCTANAIGAAVQYNQMKQQLQDVFVPSRLFIYYEERVLMNTVNADSGAMLRDGIKVVAKLGAPRETLWPYVIEKFTRRPNKRVYHDAEKHQALIYQRVPQTLTMLKSCLAEGYPFVFGFMVYDGFESEEVTRTGIAHLPTPDEKGRGGHAVLGVGYDEPSQRFLIRNSWGPSWGMGGYFTMPYEYLTNDNLSTDFWTIRLVEA